MSNEVLRVTMDGEFIWHERADELIDTGDFSASPATQFILRALRDRDRLQAQIDRLMLEYCPDEMTPAQLSEWARNQRAVDPGEII